MASKSIMMYAGMDLFVIAAMGATRGKENEINVLKLAGRVA